MIEDVLPRRNLLLGMAAGAVIAPAAGASTLGVTQRRTALVNGTPVDYDVAFDRFPVRAAATGAPATVYVLTYRRRGPPGEKRPVVFAFNGGPGAPTVWLNYAAFGPRRIAVPPPGDAATGKASKVTADAAGLLDIADLVFIDPVDTGFSRAAGGTAAAGAFFDTEEDGRYVAQVIRDWLIAYRRTADRVFIVGESFGCPRAAVAVHWLTAAGGGPPANLAGLVLVSPGLNFNDAAERRLSRNITGSCVQLPSIARLAWYHGLVTRDGSSAAAFEARARQFAGSAYLAALFKGRSIPADEARSVASALQGFTGIPADYFLANRLAISRDTFRRRAMQDRGLVLGQYDARYVAKQPPGNDRFDPFVDVVIPAFERTAAAELRGLPVPMAAQAYRFASPAAQEQWRFFNSAMAERPYTRYVEDALRQRAALRLLVVAGRYDLGAGDGLADYLLDQADFPTDRVTRHYYDAGHMVYASDEGRIAFVEDIRRLMAS